MSNKPNGVDPKYNNIIRQTVPKNTEGRFQLPTGYGGEESITSDLFMPPCGITDIDNAVFRLFDKDLRYAAKQVQTKDGLIDFKKPGVVMAAGERAGLIKRIKPLRDPRTNALILPLVAIRQVSIDQEYDDMASRGINPYSGEVTVKRKLSSEDANYQMFLNKLGLINQSRLPRQNSFTGENSKDISIEQGMLLDPKLGNNIFEIITIPAPQFITIKYEVIFWTLDIRHLYYMIETMLAAQLPQGKHFQLYTQAGYWFIGSVGENITAEDNFDDFTEEKRLVKKKFDFEVKAYIVAPNGPNNMVPIKRYYSCPTIALDVKEGISVSKKKIEAQDTKLQSDKFTLSDFEADPDLQPQESTGDKFLLKTKRFDSRTGKSKEVFVKVVENKNGETIYTASDRETLLETLYSKKRFG